MAVLWQETSAEYRALCYQAYNIARMRLEQDLKQPVNKKRAIIVDMDETIIDNSLYNAVRVIREQDYPREFYDWISSAKADVIAGAMDFLNFADKKGYEIFYLTNRRMECFDISLNQLKKMSFPQTDKYHVILKKKTSNKQFRIDKISKKYHVAFLLGDNCDDFSEAFYEKQIEERLNAVDNSKDEFGKKFIILPNPVHGSWKKAIYDYKRGLSMEDKTRIRLEKLKTIK